MIRTDPDALRCALGIVRGRIIFYLGFRKICGLFGIPFSRKGVVTGNGSFHFCILEKPVRTVVDIVFRCGPSREKSNRQNPQIFPIGKYKQYSAKIAQSTAEGILKSSRTEVFPQKIGKRIASFFCFLYNKGKIN